jgi:RimJ/RimL family protein N-acetyltransferase
MQLQLEHSVIRSWRPEDVGSLVQHANDRRVWMNVRDRFPHPYGRRDGLAFIRMARRVRPETLFAIAVNGEAVGGIGAVLQHDVERISAEIGYWLGFAYWGRGIGTEAVREFTRHAIRRYHLTRLFAVVFEYNTASCRVLEKAGYELEGRLRRSAIKDGQIVDQFQYAFVSENVPNGTVLRPSHRSADRRR